MKTKKAPIIYRATNGNNSQTKPCPYCAKRHIHGYVEGHRNAHCGTVFSKRRQASIIKGNQYPTRIEHIDGQDCIIINIDGVEYNHFFDGYILKEVPK